MYSGSVHLCLTLRCNGKCPYCSNILPICKAPYLYEETKPENWIKLIEKLEEVDIYLTGGEIFLFDGVVDILSNIPERKSCIKVYTNGSLISEELILRIDPTKVVFRCSYHSCLEPVESFLEKMKILEARGIPFQIFMVDVPEEETLKLKVDFFRKEGYEIGVDYDQRRISHKKEKVDCYLPTIIVSPSGEVFNCVSRMIRHESPMGNIFEKGEFPVLRPIVCDESGMCTSCDLAAAYQQSHQSSLPSIFKKLEREQKIKNFIFVSQDTLQHESELEALVDFVFNKSEIKTILEIGVHKGGTAYVWLQLAESKVILIDESFQRSRIYEGKRFSPSLFEIEGDSCSEKVVERVKGILAGDKVDLLFIDGSHDQLVVEKDFKIYSNFVRFGGWIALHDVFNEACPVRFFWGSIKNKYEYWEFDIRNQIPEKKKTVWGERNPQGIGLVRWLKQ